MKEYTLIDDDIDDDDDNNDGDDDGDDEMGAPPPCLQNFIQMKPITYMACLSIDRPICVHVFVFISLTFVAYSRNVSISLREIYFGMM